MKAGKRTKKIILGILIAIFALCLALSIFVIIGNTVLSVNEEAKFEELAEQFEVETTEETETKATDEIVPEEKQPGNTAYKALQEENGDFAGWLTISDTKINYPVMWTPTDPEYYIHRDFYGAESKSGTPFIGEGGDVDSDAFIIFGHKMRNKSMFGTLDNYKKASFREKVPTFTFTTPTEERTYEVFAAVSTRLLYQDEEGFRYYYSSGDKTKDEYNELRDWLIANSDYDTGIIPQYGEQILMLSTCSYHTDNGRFVVAARRIS